MIKGIQALNHEPDYIVDGTQSSLQVMSVGDLKENKDTFIEAYHKECVFIFWCLYAFHSIQYYFYEGKCL